MEETAATFEPAPRKPNAWKRFVLISGALLLLGLIVFYLISGMSYSEGTRSGVLTKVSRKGYLFKTYEGEMNVGGINQGDGTIMPLTIFRFSVRDKKVYQELEALQGKKVVVHYKQVIRNFFWQGETDYFVEKVSPAN